MPPAPDHLPWRVEKQSPSQQGGTCPLSEIRVTTISDTAGTGPVTLTKQSAAKAWVTKNLDGTAIEDSFNVSTLTDVGTGIATYSFTNSFANNTYQSATGSRHIAVRIYSSPDGDITTSSLKINSYNLSEALADRQSGTAVHGDLA